MNAVIFLALAEVQAGIRGPLSARFDPVFGLTIKTSNPDGGYELLEAAGDVFGVADFADGYGEGPAVEVDEAVVKAFLRGAQWAVSASEAAIDRLSRQLDAAKDDAETFAGVAELWRRRVENAERERDELLDEIDSICWSNP